MLAVDLESITGVVQLRPSGPLTEEDFKKAESSIEKYIDARGPLQGLLIHSKSFPGWDSLSAFIKHMQFLSKNQTKP